MRYVILFIVLILSSCGSGSSSTVTKPVFPPLPTNPEPENVVVKFTTQSEDKGYGGRVSLLDDGALFESNTNPACVTKSFCKRVEMSKTVKFPVRISYTLSIEKWDTDEYKCGTHKGVPKGCSVILTQFWNKQAAPRAYVVAQKKPDGWRIALHNKNDDAVFQNVWETYVTGVTHNITLYSDGRGASLTVNGESSGYHELDITSDYPDYLKWGMYWPAEMDGSIVTRFKNVQMSEGD